METRWWWVRHGPTHQKAFTGWRDVPADLSDQAAIARLAEYLPACALVVSSDLIRASATADAIAGPRQRLPHEPDFREIHLGDWDGKLFPQVAKEYPDLSRAYWETPGDITAPGGESWNETATRASRLADRMTAENAGQDIIAVAHMGVILTQLQRALGQTPAQALGQKIDNLSVTCLVFSGSWRAEVINHRP